MSRPSHPSPCREPVSRGSAAERARSAARTERYDSETLPVLLRLPDVYGTCTRPPVTLQSQHDVDALAGAASSDTPSPAQRRGSEPAEPSSTGGCTTSRRTPRTERRRAVAADAPGWLPGVRRFLFAVLMAAVLLAVIITIEQWNGPAPRAGAPTLPKQSAAAVPEAGLPELAPAANATWTPPGIPEDTARHTAPETGGVVPASATVSDASWAARVDAVPSGTGWADAGESPATATAAGTANVTPIAPNAAGYADGVDVGTVPAAYPSTGRGPVLPDLPAPSAASPPPWPRPAGQPAVHRADRNPPGASYPTR